MLQGARQSKGADCNSSLQQEAFQIAGQVTKSASISPVLSTSAAEPVRFEDAPVNNVHLLLRHPSHLIMNLQSTPMFLSILRVLYNYLLFLCVNKY